MLYENLLSEMNEQDIVLYPSKMKLLLKSTGSLGFVVLVIFMIRTSNDPTVYFFGIAAAIIFGLYFMWYIFLLFVPRPILVVNDEGIHNYFTYPLTAIYNYVTRRPTRTSVKWEEIGAIYRER